MSTPTKSRRLEARIEPELDDLITEAAGRIGQSRSEFIVHAARESAERVLARADITFMSEQQFDVLIDSLEADQPVEKLTRAASGERAYRRR